MLKEIFEQPQAVRDTILGRVSLDTGRVFLEEMTVSEADLARDRARDDRRVRHVVARRAGRQVPDRGAGASCRSKSTTAPSTATATRSSATKTLAVVITQSGETADTLAALREAKAKGARSIAICNVVGSMATRESDGTVYTHAGPGDRRGVDQGVHVAAGRAAPARAAPGPGARHAHARAVARRRSTACCSCRRCIEQTLQRVGARWTKSPRRFYNRRDFLFLGRGINYPIALEGALKLKEISYIHAEGYPAGEMKHGPIALIDEQMPVVALAPRDHVFEKMLSNIQEVKARGGSIIALTTGRDELVEALLDTDARLDHRRCPKRGRCLSPVVMVLPLQLLAYHIAVRRGCDVDQPRNLAKSVTVE